MARFVMPDRAMQPPPPDPPTDPAAMREQAIADSTRAEEALNRFLAAKQAALQQGMALVKGAKEASQIDVGGGQNAVSAMLGGLR